MFRISFSLTVYQFCTSFTATEKTQNFHSYESLSDQIYNDQFHPTNIATNRTFTGVPMQESFSSEHSRELFTDSFEQLLDGSTVANESSRHLETSGRNVTHGCLDVVGNPFHEVAAVLILHVQHLFIYFLHRHSAWKTTQV